MFKCSMQRKMDEANEPGVNPGFKWRSRYAEKAGYSVECRGPEETYTLKNPFVPSSHQESSIQELYVQVILWIDTFAISVKIMDQNKNILIRDSYKFASTAIVQDFKDGIYEGVNRYLNTALTTDAKNACNSIFEAAHIVYSGLRETYE